MVSPRPHSSYSRMTVYFVGFRVGRGTHCMRLGWRIWPQVCGSLWSLRIDWSQTKASLELGAMI